MLACNQPALSVFAYGECRDREESQSNSEPVGKALCEARKSHLQNVNLLV